MGMAVYQEDSMVGIVRLEIVLLVDYFLESQGVLQILGLENNHMSKSSISNGPDISKLVESITFYL